MTHFDSRMLAEGLALGGLFAVIAAWGVVGAALIG
ncbi:hypothetical protein SAMN05421742_11136 [Roseospirillum parvum]|uniref:Uncharacterized protein n=1 Tax=Roseospirillum parvum TaxID=83401 RepID=A0A1G8ETY7_9PROT|nr:hypothetical protein SAMN05421742_11136 [Roseospirillum parvum]